MVSEKAARGPWPGPLPYGEEDRNEYYGRAKETDEVAARLQADRLVLLTANSGVGKTSFLRAALLPELRRRRRLALEVGDTTAEPAILLVRNWLSIRSNTADDFFVRAISLAIKDSELRVPTFSAYDDDAAMRQIIENDYEILKSVQESSSAYEYIEKLANAVGSLTIVLDQFEEAVQGSSQQTDDVLNIVAVLRYNCSKVRLVLSFRQEFWNDFYKLDSRGDYRYELREIEGQTLRGVLESSAIAGKVDLQPELVDKLMHSVEEMRTRLPSMQAPLHSVLQSVELLRLQALLRELYQVADTEEGKTGWKRIDLNLLSRLDGASDEQVGNLCVKLLDSALERFIDQRVLPRAANEALLRGVEALEQRRAAARMAEFFWTGTLKNAQNFAPLVARIWRDEWPVLGTTAERVEDVLDDRAPESLAEPGLGRALGLSDRPADKSSGVLSGSARSGGWSPAQVADHLLEISQRAIDQLVDGHVLSAKPGLGGVTYELVHDGFGPAFVAWAEDQLQTPEFVLVATTAQRGQELNWDKLTGLIQDACWRGCWVGPTTPDGNLIFEHVQFDNCDLTGTLFDHCTFKGTLFRNSDLDLVVFQNCVFEPDPEDDTPVVFDAVRASGLTIHGGAARKVRFTNESLLWKMWWGPVRKLGGTDDDFDLSDVEFHDCAIAQWTVDNVSIVGPVSLHNCLIVLSDLFGLVAGSETIAFEDNVVFDNCTFQYCPVNTRLQQAIQSRNNVWNPQVVEDWDDVPLPRRFNR